MNTLEENDLVYCTVNKIEGTTVFVLIEEKTQGSIVFSEIAAGRIRNIREYVSPGKKIVCKILKIYADHVELSLRRVTGKEREEVQERYKKERNFTNILKTSVTDFERVLTKIRAEYELWDFIDHVKENPKILLDYVDKTQSDNLIKLLQEKREKEKVVKKIFILKSTSDTGLFDIKDTLKIKNHLTISYLGSSQFLIESTGKDFKEAEHKVLEAISEIEKKAKDKKCTFEVKDK